MDLKESIIMMATRSHNMLGVKTNFSKIEVRNFKTHNMASIYMAYRRLQFISLIFDVSK